MAAAIGSIGFPSGRELTDEEFALDLEGDGETDNRHEAIVVGYVDCTAEPQPRMSTNAQPSAECFSYAEAYGEAR